MNKLMLALACLMGCMLVMGCGVKPDEPAPAPPTPETTGQVEAIEVDIEDVEIAVESEPKTPAPDDAVADKPAADDADPTTDAPDAAPEPKGPRPSVFVRALTQPLEEAARENVESLQKTAGQLRLP